MEVWAYVVVCKCPPHTEIDSPDWVTLGARRRNRHRDCKPMSIPKLSHMCSPPGCFVLKNGYLYYSAQLGKMLKVSRTGEKQFNGHYMQCSYLRSTWMETCRDKDPKWAIKPVWWYSWRNGANSGWSHSDPADPTPVTRRRNDPWRKRNLFVQSIVPQNDDSSIILSTDPLAIVWQPNISI